MVNVDLSGTGTLSVGGYPNPANDHASMAVEFVLTSGTYHSDLVDNAGATLEAFETTDPTKFPGEYSAWWKWTADADLIVEVDASYSSLPSGVFTFQTFYGPAEDDLTELNNSDYVADLVVDEGTTLWFRAAHEAPGATYEFQINTADQPLVGDALADGLEILGVEGILELDLASATLESGEDTPSGVTRTLWGIWEVPSDEVTRERFRITSGDATLRFYVWDADTETLTLVVESTAVPADILVIDLDETLEYRVQIGGKTDDLVTLEWFSGEPSLYNDFADALEIDPVYGSQVLSLMNNTLETLETSPGGVESTGWLTFTAEDTNTLNFSVVADLAQPFTVQVYSGSSLGALTLEDTISSVIGEEVSFSVDMVALDQFYLQFSAADDFINFNLNWNIDPVVVAPYEEVEDGDTDPLDDPGDVGVEPDDGYMYTPPSAYDTVPEDDDPESW